MLTVKSNNSTRRLVVPELLKRLKLVTLETNNDGDTLILEIKDNITLAQVVKVITPLKFNSKLFKLKEFIIKIKIYLNYIDESFELKDNKTIFIISYFERLTFNFISTYIEDYN
jgi:hypothetical protein